MSNTLHKPMIIEIKSIPLWRIEMNKLMRSNLFYSILLLIFITSFSSCVDDYVLDSLNNPAKIVVQCEVNPDNVSGNRAFVSTSLDINGNGKFGYPDDATVSIEYMESIKTPEMVGEPIFLSYEDEGIPYYKFPAICDFNSGDRLEMKVHLKDSKITDVIAQTTIPFPLVGEKSSQEVIMGDVVDEHFTAKVNSHFDFSNCENVKYVKVIAKLGFQEYVTLADGTIKYKVEERKYLYTDLSDSYTALSLIHKKGVYFDLTEQKTFDISYESTFLMPENSVISTINYTYYTLSEDVYKYDVSIDNSIRSKDSPYTEPIVSHSNISNGIGLLGSVCAKTEIIEL